VVFPVKDFAFLLLLQQPESGSGGISVFLPMTVMVLIFYFLILRPQQKRQRRAQVERESFLKSLRLGDKVVTVAGIYGTIVALRGDTVHLKVAPSVSLTIMRDSVAGRAAAEIEELEEIEG
jgi:preprotein translocase subunit YajC